MQTRAAYRGTISALLIGWMMIGAAGCRESGDPPHPTALEEPAAEDVATLLGGDACTGCHPAETARWRDSHHDRAMQPANESTVLGDFENARFEKDGVVSRFFRRNGRFLVETDGPEGALEEYEISWTFGVEPLQQYLIEFPDGRIQALGIAWDTRPKDEQGQRWFHVYGDEPTPAGDALHWTGPAQRWNFMCADCHSTGYRKGYDAVARRFSPSWSDPDVGCEACHGPASLHVARAEAGRLEEGSGFVVDLTLPPERHLALVEGRPTRRIVSGGSGAHPDNARGQVEVCGSCHARRAPIRDGYRHGASLLDSYEVTLLTEPEYHPDGQIREEVYVYGSFVQSRMYAAGVVCTDCHEPHSLTLRAEGDALCAQCHAPAYYAAPSHTHHAGDDQTGERPASRGDIGSRAAPSCADCHMPARDYMVVDRRRDHSFRVPRPDLAESLGVSDACAACHGDQPIGWSARAVRSWLGRDASGLQDFAETFRAAGTRQLTSAEPLLDLLRDATQPPIVRATALTHLRDIPTRAGLALSTDALEDPDPLVRRAALGPLALLPPAERVARLVPRLDDETRAVRIEAARLLASVEATLLDGPAQQRLRSTIDEYEIAQRASLDTPPAWLNLGNLYTAQGHVAAAEHAYREALLLDSRFVPAYANLADLLSREGREQEAGETLRAGLVVVPRSAVLMHALGLHRIRVGEKQTALAALAQAVEWAPDDARFRYVRAIAIAGEGRSEEARALLEETHRLAPGDGDVLNALIGMSLDAGEQDAARAWARALQRLQPDNPHLAALRTRLGDGSADEEPR